MSITVKLSSALRQYVKGYDPHQGLELELKPNQNVDELIEQLGLPKRMVKIVMVNGRSAPLDRTIQDGDRLGIFPAVGGG